MFYVDTSVIVAYYCPEPLSEKAESFSEGLTLITADEGLSKSAETLAVDAVLLTKD